jgi:hypothetical protein
VVELLEEQGHEIVITDTQTNYGIVPRDELESLMKARNYAEAEELIPSIAKFASVLTEEQRDFLGAARLAIAEKHDWTA